MRAIASFIMRGPVQAACVVVIGALLPLLSVVSGAPLALVTLRQGARQGILVVAMAAALAGLLFWLLFNALTPLLGLLGLLLPLWILALVLRHSLSLAATLKVSLLMASFILLACAVYVGDLAVWGRALLEEAMAPFIEQAQLDSEQAAMTQVLAYLDYLSPIALGLLVASSLLTVLLSLLLGRWWQALLFNPGGFRQEFQELRLGQPMALVASLVFAGAWLLKFPVLTNLVLLVIVIYALQGIALLHGVVSKARLNRFWLVGFYGLMLVIPLYVILLLCLLGFIDAWLDVRERLKPPQKTS
jgi:hypothetical protein